MDENKIVSMYQDGGYTLRHLADIFGTNHHRIKRILVAHGVKITRRNTLKEFSEEHRRKISESCKGRKVWSEGKAMTEEFKRKNMKAKLKTEIDLDKYPDYEKLYLLTSILSKRKEHIGYDDLIRELFLDKFYFDANFNSIFDKWKSVGENKWYRPTLDHKVSQANGGTWDLENLQFLTWFENRAKAEMNQDEWEEFKNITNTTSDLFL